MRCVSFFFFKQKTAYEMRISDWSSDVCSSDLARAGAGDGSDRDLAAADADQDFGRRANQRKAGQVEEIEEGRRIDAAQRAIEVEGRQVEGGLEALREDRKSVV